MYRFQSSCKTPFPLFEGGHWNTAGYQLDWIQKRVDIFLGYCSPQEFFWSRLDEVDRYLMVTSWTWAKDQPRHSTYTVGNPCKGFPTSNGQTFGLWTSRVTRFMKCNVHLSLSYLLSPHPIYFSLQWKCDVAFAGRCTLVDSSRHESIDGINMIPYHPCIVYLPT